VTGRDGKTYPAARPATPEEAAESILQDAEDGILPTVKTQLLDGDPADPRDSLGIPIQAHAAAAFEPFNLACFADLISTIKAIRKEVSALADAPGGALLQRECAYERRGEGGNWRLPALENLLKTLESCVPSVTDCPLAFGDAPHPDPCPLCHNLRWLGPIECYPQVTPEMVARMRQHYGVGS
jgi:hypothetical protein